MGADTKRRTKVSQMNINSVLLAQKRFVLKRCNLIFVHYQFTLKIANCRIIYLFDW